MTAISKSHSPSLPRAVAAPARAALTTRFVDLLSSVRFGVLLLVLLALASVAGMLVMQVNVEGFDKYYAELSPATRLLFGTLGLFDIYHSWYFNVLLLVLSFNIILSSIDNFPKAWTYIGRRKLDASAHWLRGQEQSAEWAAADASARALAERIGAACRAERLRATVTERQGATFVFAERGAWNRLGAYAVHVALLVIFAGGFLTAQLGHTGQMMLAPGAARAEMAETSFDLDKPRQSTVQLPFEVECTDIQQKLLDKNGPVNPMNTLDWLTAIKIRDPARGETDAVVRLNRPFDYRGYRFFQASFVPEGRARTVTLKFTPEQGGATEQVTLKRDETATLNDGTRVRFADFYSDFALQGTKATSQSDEYNNPAAAVMLSRPDGAAAKGYAFTAAARGAGPLVGQAVAGYKVELVEFEKVGAAHILSVQKDPGATVVYAGFALLSLTLVGVFFCAHQRVWARIEPRAAGGYAVTFGGNTNRGRIAFEERFKRLVKAAGAEFEAQS
ncbi:MAG TPA: cytochrome c biogenesis protein ResB [Pyrinomonadaceae bacterium]|jgi:cytochrome c biogenesis protein